MNPQERFCPNSSCPAKGQVGKGNVVIHSQKERRYKCTVCGKTFAATTSTPFYRLRHGQDLVTTVITLLAYGCPLQAVVAAFELDERTVSHWQERAGEHCQHVHEHLVEQPRDLQHVQADEIRVKAQGQILWMAMAMMVSTRLWLGGAISAQRDRHLITLLIEKVRACALARPLLICVDGLSTYVMAIGKVFRSPWRTGNPGRPKLIAWPDIHIGQVIKRYEKKRVVAVVQRMARGSLETAQVLLEKSCNSRHLNVAFIERLNGTFRSRLAPLERRTRSLVRTAATLNSAMYLIGCVYNFCADHKGLRLPGVIGGRRKWLPRTPAMAAGITDHRWTVKELLSYRVPPPPWTPPKRRGRPSKAIQALQLRWCT